MKLPKLTILAIGLIALAAGTTDASAATKRISGSQLAALLYGQKHTVYMPTGIGFSVRYDGNGVMYANGQKTGEIVKATKSGWCDFRGSKLRMCLTIWKVNELYVAKTSSGTPVFAFTVP